MVDNIAFVNITDNVSEYKERIQDFLSLLDSERRYMAFSFGRVISSPLVIAVFDGDVIIGLTGLEKKIFFFCTYIILNKNYQGMGLGKKLTTRLLENAKYVSRFIFSIMLIENVASFRQHVSAGAKLVGVRRGTYYLYWIPAGMSGVLFYRLVKLSFPLIKLYDFFHFSGKS